jgi:hypothetical protein
MVLFVHYAATLRGQPDKSPSDSSCLVPGATLVLLVGGWSSSFRTKKWGFVHSLAGVTENARNAGA